MNNCSEFSGIHDLLIDITDIYFTRPYASYERETKNKHKLIRRFIPEGEVPS